jgi:hypothetical protein
MLSLLCGNLYDALNAGPRGLRLRGHDSNLLTSERIQQRALARIRPADDRNKSRSHCHILSLKPETESRSIS